jgi:hypothetical protein
MQASNDKKSQIAQPKRTFMQHLKYDSEYVAAQAQRHVAEKETSSHSTSELLFN